RARPLVVQDGVRTGLLAPRDHGCVFVLEGAELNGAGRARLLTGRDHFTGPNRRAFDAGANLRRADALHAVRAFLHHAALPHGDLGISLHARGRLVARVLEVVEAADLVGTVVRAEPRPDAAVVDHLVQAVGAVNGGVHRTHVLAGRHLAVLAEHRLMHDARALVLAEEVGVDAQPVHFP